MTAKMTALYRHYSVDGALLYVGISTRLMTRTKCHVDDAVWMPETASIHIEWFSSVDDARAAEKKAIKAERPVHNLRHTGKSKYPRPDWQGEVVHPRLLSEIYLFCEETSTPTSIFGRMSVNDPSLVTDVMNGRELRKATRDKVRNYMLTGRPQANAA